MNNSQTMDSSPTVSRRPSMRTVVVVAWLVMLIDGYDLMALGAAGPSILASNQWPVDRSFIGLVASATAVAMPVGAIAAGWASDRLGRRLPMAAILMWVSATMLLAGLAPSADWFLVARVGTGIGIGALVPLVVASVNDVTVNRSRVFVNTGIVMTGLAAGGLLSTLVALTTSTNHDFQLIFLAGAFAVLTVPVVWRVMPGIPVATNASGQHKNVNRLTELFSTRYRLFTILAWGALFSNFIVIFASTTWLPTLLQSSGFNTNASLVFSLVFNAGAIGGTILVVYLANGRAKLALLAGACFLCAAVAMLLLGVSSSSGAILVACALAGVGALGTNAVIVAFIANLYPGWLRGTGLGYGGAVGRLGAIIGPAYVSLVIGSSAAGDAKSGFLAIAVPAVVGFVIVLAIYTLLRTRSDSADDAVRDSAAGPAPVDARR